MEQQPMASFAEANRTSTSSWYALNLTALPEIPDDCVSHLNERSQRRRTTRSRSYSQLLDQESKDATGALQHSPSASNLIPCHQPTKHFSGLYHALDEIRAVSRRASMSIRRKNILRPRVWDTPVDGDPTAEGNRPSTSWSMRLKPSTFARTHGWLRRAASASFGQRERLSTNTSPTSSCSPAEPSVPSPVPGSGLDPPILPFSRTSGAAARAAAAAQNEILGAGRVWGLKDNTYLAEPKVTRDSESGIGIDLRDRIDEAPDAETSIVRIDPTNVLPPELIAQIFSYLDSSSLLQLELVSRTWRAAAVSHHVWKHIFQREYGKPSPRGHGPSTGAAVGGRGLGRLLPGQDWKRMFHLRKALQVHWEKGQATAIYLEGHTDCVYCVQFDEEKIITGSRDQTIRVWDIHTFECINIIGTPPNTILPSGHVADSSAKHITPPEYHQASILSLQFDRNILVTGSSDCTCIVWDIEDDYRPIHRLRCHTAGVLDVCFDDKHIVSCSKDTTLCVWDRHTCELLTRLVGHRGPVNAVQLRGNLAVSASGDGIAKLWNLTSGSCIKEFTSRDRGLACIEFSEDARTILAGGNDQVIYQFDTNSGELIRELKGHKGLVRSLHLDGANGRIISGSYDMSVKVFDFESGDLVVDFPGWATSWMLGAKADYRRIVATSQDSRAVIMDFGYGLPDIEMLEGW